MSDQTVLIRRATVADAPIIVAHRRAMCEAMGYTHPDYRRQSLARRLMAAILDYCRVRKLRMISLPASSEGRSLYESLGFQQTNEMRLKLSVADKDE